KLTDWYSTPLDGTTVTARNTTTGAEARTVTGKSGTYKFSGLAAGEYTLLADSPQLGRGQVEGIIVSAGHEARVQAAIQLELPRRAPIQAAFHEIDPAAQVVSTTLPAEQLQQLPLTGRHWQDFTLDTPAASSSSPGETQTALRGAGQSAAEVTVDDSSRTLAFGATGTTAQTETGQSEIGSAWAQGRGANLGGPAMSQTAIREVQISAGNAEAQADRAAAGAMHVETRSGTNALHGQGFLFDRQNSWGAQNPFTQWVQQTAPATELTTPAFTPIAYTPSDREVTFGAGIGGRIKRDKLFWFGAFDGYLRNDPGLSTVKNPSEFFLQPTNDDAQVLAARLGLSSVNPVAEGLAAYSQMLGTLDSLLGPAPRTATQQVGFARIDWQAAERHRFTFEGIGALWNSPGGGLTRVSETYGNHSFGSSHADEQWALARWEAFLTPNLLAVSRVRGGATC
ncbi:MAG: carboxypeptidase-like regulatory domain-containing protein, partial [Terracidiphilus sp.]